MTKSTKTAQSIYTTLDSLITETSVPGQTPKMQAHTLPREMFPTSEQFEDREKLQAWAVGADVIHACLQKGVQKHLIDCRAKFKSCKKDDTWTNEYGQNNLDSYKWEVQARPNVNKNDMAVETARYQDCLKAVANMLAAKMADDTIHMALNTVYTAEIVEGSLTALKSAS